MAVQFKFVELSIVTDESLETTVNEWVGQGWHLEGIRFVTTEHSKRPAMAFVSFTRDAAQETADKEAPRKPPPLIKPASTAGVPRAGDGTPRIEDDGDGPRVITAAAGTDVD